MTRALLGLALTTLLTACSQEMDTQRRYDAYERPPDMPDFNAGTSRPAGTVDQDAQTREAELRTRPTLDGALLARGQQRFGIYCAPCHGFGGDGDGMIVQRGMPRPPSFHSARLRTAPDAHFMAVITQGYGVMYSYADRVAPRDRWAIIAYIRALQLSRNAPVAELPEALRKRLNVAP